MTIGRFKGHNLIPNEPWFYLSHLMEIPENVVYACNYRQYSPGGVGGICRGSDFMYPAAVR